MRKRPVPPEEPGSAAELFRRELGEVVPLRAGARVHPGGARPAPVPRQRIADEKAALDESLRVAWDGEVETGEDLRFVRDGIGAATLRRLRRGEWVIQDELDLHGLTVPDARELLAVFLARAARAGLRCVRIIHGKGLRSRNRQPVLKAKVAAWLAQRDEVLAYCQARPVDGGGGAVVVLLKGGRRKAEG
ncbi:MAG: Smr/MutS family protein [Burkholderiales bacterium]|nr:Smr/MutS family protein [Burkholderiales bacterium]